MQLNGINILIDLTAFIYGLIPLLLYLIYISIRNKPLTIKQLHISILILCVNLLFAIVIKIEKVTPPVIDNSMRPAFTNYEVVVPSTSSTLIEHKEFNKDVEQKINDALAIKIENQAKTN